MRQAAAAKKLGIAPSTLKHVCRKLGVGRWPWRDHTYTRDRSATKSAGSGAAASAASSQSSPAAAARGHVDDAQRYAEYLQSLGGPAGGERPVVRPTDAFAARNAGHHLAAGDGHLDGAEMLLPRVQAKTWEAMDRNSRGLLDEALKFI